MDASPDILRVVVWVTSNNRRLASVIPIAGIKKGEGRGGGGQDSQMIRSRRKRHQHDAVR